MKRKILLVDKSFAIGGIQSSLINMVKALGDKYEIHVLMFNNNGKLKKFFPKNIKVIEPNFLMRIHGMDVADAKKRGILTYLFRLITGVSDKLFTNRISLWFAMLFQKKIVGYDVAIAYHHEPSNKATVSGFYRFVQRKTDAPIKIGWIHYDPEFITFDDKKNLKYMQKMDKIVCVSKGAQDKFLSYHPSLSGIIDYCYNFHDIDRVLYLSEQVGDVKFDSEKFNCFTACRLSDQKAIPRAIEAFAPVLRKNPDVMWYIAGDGNDRVNCEAAIKRENIGHQVILMGATDNPFSYMKNCDLFILPSIYEAAPMVYGEALICKAPIFTTVNVSSYEMLDEKFSYICENSIDGMRAGLDYILSNRKIVETFKENLLEYNQTNNLSYQKFEELTRKGE
ncbi:MAG: glycosyltransferase [Clostridia bacterium]|nr:glycosyltransferase [Clostridia bacterium]